MPQGRDRDREKYLVAPYSVDRHITYIKEVRTVANGRDQTRADANVRIMENKGSEGTTTRTDASVPGPEDRYDTDDDFRFQLVSRIGDPVIAHFGTGEYESYAASAFGAALSRLDIHLKRKSAFISRRISLLASQIGHLE